MNLFVKITMATSAFIVVVVGVIIAAQMFYPMSESIDNATSNSDVSEVYDFYVWIFGGAMLVLVVTPIAWYLYATSADEAEGQVYYRRQY